MDTRPEHTTLIDYLQPFLEASGKTKHIPEWIFEVSQGDRDVLDEITVFGLDVDDVL